MMKKGVIVKENRIEILDAGEALAKDVEKRCAGLASVVHKDGKVVVTVHNPRMIMEVAGRAHSALYAPSPAVPNIPPGMSGIIMSPEPPLPYGARYYTPPLANLALFS